MKNKAKIIAVIGLIMINIGLSLSCIELKKERDKYYTSVIEKEKAYEDLEIRLQNEVSERLKLQYQNEALWEAYHSQVSDFE